MCVQIFSQILGLIFFRLILQESWRSPTEIKKLFTDEQTLEYLNKEQLDNLINNNNRLTGSILEEKSSINRRWMVKTWKSLLSLSLTVILVKPKFTEVTATIQ